MRFAFPFPLAEHSAASGSVSCLTVGAGCVPADGGLRKVPSEPKSVPIVLSAVNQPDAVEFLIPQGQSSQGSSKLHIDIPSIDDCPGV